MARDRGKTPRRAPEGGWPTKSKSPRIAEPSVAVGKAARSLNIDHADVMRRRLVWRFSDHDDEGQHTLSAITPAHLVGLLSKLRSFESMTLGELFAPDSEHGKTYTVESMPSEAQKRLTAIGRDDETEVARLRCSGTQRLYGFLRENVFHILWWDPEHQVWPSTKRGT